MPECKDQNIESIHAAELLSVKKTEFFITKRPLHENHLLDVTL